jgi:AcrR family transcriptional regulator
LELAMPTQQQRTEETRQAILQAAQQRFAHVGYEATSVAAICDAAGVSKGAFYHHFNSKQQVFLDLLNHWLAVLDAQIEELRVQAASVPQALMAMSELAKTVLSAADEQVPLYLEFWSAAARDPAIWQATIAPYHRYRAYFARLIRTGIEEGSLREVDPESTARAIVALAVGLILQGLLDPRGADWTQVMRQSIRVMLQGLIRES